MTNEMRRGTEGWSLRARQLQEKWESLTIANNYIFTKVMSDPTRCKELLDRILPDLHISHIEYAETEKTMTAAADSKGVRLDAFSRDQSGRAYGIEMQMSDTKELPQRSRYYGGIIDQSLLERGENYQHLPESYVIFICPFDLFEQGRHKYVFRMLCAEDPVLQLGDGREVILLNTKGMKEDISPELKAFLDLVNGKESDDIFVRKVQESVSRAKRNKDWRREYMLWEQDMLIARSEAREEGRAEGRKEGREQGLQEGRISAIKNLVEKLYLTPEEAMDTLGIPKEECPAYLEKLGR